MSAEIPSQLHSFNPCNRFNDNGFFTFSSTEQKRVEDIVGETASSFFASKSGNIVQPELYRAEHGSYLLNCLRELPIVYQELDASRPWLCYWAVHALRILNVTIPDDLKRNIVRFLETCQDENGGYGGGPGQMAHLAVTYAAVLTLASLESTEALQTINRPNIRRFLKSMHQKNGSFTMHKGGEADIRGMYCSLAVASLLRILDEDLTEGCAEWIVLSKLADMQALLKWLSRKQMRFEGGFQGRTNKLVDSCYSFWQAAIFRIVDCEWRKEGLLSLGEAFDFTALQEYILICCQEKDGGMKDKPEKKRDVYHSCYALSGLSIAQSFCCNKAELVGGESNALEEIHPVYNITTSSEQFANRYFQSLP